jgi:hypothetical protein
VNTRITIFSIFLLSLSFLKSQTFSDVMQSSGITTTNLSIDGWGAGISFYDFNQDGWDDLSFAKGNSSQAIYINNQGSFQASPILINNGFETKMFLWVDYDNDGDLDIFITTKHGKNHLYQNDGNFVFADVTTNAGLYAGAAENCGAAFSDYDKDGFLDLYVTRYYIGGGDSTNLIFTNNLYHNNGDGTFTDVSFSAGVSDGLKQSFQGVWFDFDNDSWPDLYVVNDKAFDGALYRNKGDGTFEDITLSANLDLSNSNLMTGSVADYNNDQYLDLFVSNTSGNMNDRPALFENQGNDTFINVYEQYIGDMNHTTWGGLWVDFDNDTKQDLYVATDFVRQSASPVENYFHCNKYPFGFSKDSLIFNGNHSASSHAVARGDFDGNGFYDIAVYNEAPDLSFLWQNSGNANNYIKITLEGTVSNKFAIGSWIKVFANGEQYSQYTMCGENYLGQNSQHHIFGLRQSTIVDSVHIEYLSGIIDKYYNLNVNQSYYFMEGENNPNFTINVQGDNPSCEGDSVVLISPNMLSYAWNTGDTTQSIVVFTPGQYSLSAIDSNGAIVQSMVYDLNEIALPFITDQTVDASCFGFADGELVLEVLNNGQGYQLEWSTGAFGDTLNALYAGFFNYTYTDVYGCTLKDSVEIESPFPLNLQVDIESQSAQGLGSIQLAVNGGVAPYSVLLDSVEIGNQLTLLDSGSYVFTVYDGNGCSLNDTLTVDFLQDTSVVSGVRNNKGALFTVSPNPFKSEISVRVSNWNCGELQLNLFDSSGKKVWGHRASNFTNRKNIQLQIEIPEKLLSGIYYLQLKSFCQVRQIKLLKY